MKLSRHLQLLRKQKQALRSFKIAALLALTTASAQAANYYWDPTMTGTGTGSGGNGNWDTTDTFWLLQGTGDTVWPNTTANTADFAGTAGTVTLTTNIVAGGLIFDTAGYTIAAGADTLSLGASGIAANPTSGTTTISGTGGVILTAAQTWTTATGGTLAVSAPVANGGFTLTTAGGGSANLTNVLSGTGGLTVNSTGVMTLSGNNTYSGATNIGAGDSLQIAAAATETYGATGAVTDSGTLYLSPASGAALTYGAAIGGTGVLTKLGAGTATLTTSGTYTGATTVSAGTLSLSGTTTLATSGVSVASAAALNVSGGTNYAFPITLNGGGSGGDGTNGLTHGSGNSSTFSFTGGINLAGSGYNNIYLFGIGNSVSINTTAISGTGGLSFNGGAGNNSTENLTINVASTYSGATLVDGVSTQAGLILGVNNALPTTTVLTLVGTQAADEGILNTNGKTQTIAGLIGTNAFGIVNGGGTLTIAGTGGNTFAGLIQGATSLVLSGTGVQNITGANNYTGTTTVNSGELLADSTGNTPLSTSAVTVNTGANVTIGDHAGTVTNMANAFTLNGNGANGSTVTTSNTLGYGALAFENSGNFSLTGAINLASNSVIYTNPVTQTGALTFTNVISGVGSLTLEGEDSATGTPHFTLTNTNTYGTTTPATLLTSNGSNTNPMLVELSTVSNVLPTSTVLTFGGTPAGATTAFNGNITLELDGISQTVAGLLIGTDTNTAAAATGTYAIIGNNATASTFTVNNAAASVFNGVIGGAGTNNNNLALAKSGAGTLTLSGTSTYTGGTTVSAGSLILIGTQDAGTGAISVTGGTLNLGNNTTNGNAALVAGNGVTLASGTTLAITQTANSALTYAAFPITMNGNATVSINGGNILTTTLASPITLNNTSGAQTATLGEIDAANTVNLQGVISGTGDFLIKAGGINNNNFLVTLNQAETYAGNTTIQSSGGDLATLRLLAGGSLPATNLTLNASATAGNYAQLDLGGQAQTLTSLVSAGTAASDRVINSTTGTTSVLTINNPASSSFGGVIGVTGSNNIALTTTGAGVLTLTGNNLYTGATTITTGTLAAAGTGANKALGGTTSIAINSGTLLLSTANQVNAAAPITMGTIAPTSGMLSVATGASQGTAATFTVGGSVTGTTSQGLGALTLNSTATLVYSGASTTLVFGTFTPNGNVLTITGYSNSQVGTGNSGSGTDDRLVFSGDQTGNFADFNFGSGAGIGVSEVALDGGYFEVIGAVPEPGTWVGGLGSFALMGWTLLRRRTRPA